MRCEICKTTDNVRSCDMAGFRFICHDCERLFERVVGGIVSLATRHIKHRVDVMCVDKGNFNVVFVDPPEFEPPQAQSDAPFCAKCGQQMQRDGRCLICPGCGAQSGGCGG